jgi:hypothetical protein
VGLFVAAFLIPGIQSARAEKDHHFDIINSTKSMLRITDTKGRCIERGTTVTWPSTIGPGQTYRVYWKDSNYVGDYGGYGCTDRDKLVAFSFSLDEAKGPQYKGYLGITHRKLSGTNWYNGQFYAESININSNSSVSGSDGPAPPSYIVALCSHNNYCFGPWSEMEMDKKDSYNWNRSYQTEDGWAFEIKEPPND